MGHLYSTVVDLAVVFITSATVKNELINRQAGRQLDLRAWPKFRWSGNKGRPHNILHGSIESAIPQNPVVGPNISGLSAIQAEL